VDEGRHLELLLGRARSFHAMGLPFIRSVAQRTDFLPTISLSIGGRDRGGGEVSHLKP